MADELRTAGATVEVVDFNAERPESPKRMVAQAAASGDVDETVIAFGQLGDQAKLTCDPDAVAALARVNYVAPAVVGTVLSEHMRQQEHGVIIALSSVAGKRLRASNSVYGSTKAGLDVLFSGLGDSLAGTGPGRPSSVGDRQRPRPWTARCVLVDTPPWERPRP